MFGKRNLRAVAAIGISCSFLSLAILVVLTRQFAGENYVNIPSPFSIISWREQFDKRIQFADDRSKDYNYVYGKIWNHVERVERMRPYAAPTRNHSTSISRQANGYLTAEILGEFHDIRSSVCDLVVICKLLNTTLVIPRLREVSESEGISSKYKGFDYIYDTEHFIAALASDVHIIETLPGTLKDFVSRHPPRLATVDYYQTKILPKVQEGGTVELIISEGGALQNVFPSDMLEYQRLRCRVAFHALRFRRDIQDLGLRMVKRLHAFGQPYLAVHLGLDRDTLAYHGCADLFQDVQTESIQRQREAMVEEGRGVGLAVDSEKQLRQGNCPVMPAAVAVLLEALGFEKDTRIFISGTELVGGQRLLLPFRAMFQNMEDRSTLSTVHELSVLYGLEDPVPFYPRPAIKIEDEKRRLLEWENAGPRPRPQPPPPARAKLEYEVEGWWGWIGETEKETPPSFMAKRERGHKLIWAALDYIVSLNADAFFPAFERDKHGGPNLASLIMGHRTYASPTLKTYRPDRRLLGRFLNILPEDELYHPNEDWKTSVPRDLNDTLGVEGLETASRIMKPTSFISHPIPECVCEIHKDEIVTELQGVVAQEDGSRSFLADIESS